MIFRRPNAVLHMAAKRARTDQAQPFGVINESQILFNLRVTEIVPVTQLRAARFGEQLTYLRDRYFPVLASSINWSVIGGMFTCPKCNTTNGAFNRVAKSIV